MINQISFKNCTGSKDQLLVKKKKKKKKRYTKRHDGICMIEEICQAEERHF